MTLLLERDVLARRAIVASGPLAPLAASLAADLGVVRRHELYFPTEKALLSREGGRCTNDGSLLEFDPFNRSEHRCPRCGAVYRGDLHDRFWIYWYQLWLAERAVHAAVLASIGVDASFQRLASDILSGYADRYLAYPNFDNVLGPSRLFFSTYLESIWLLQICIATDLLAPAHPSLAARVKDRIIEPARSIIAVYDEGGSNRQVWNDVALFASSTLLGDGAAAERAMFGGSGIVSHLSGGLLPDGTWYEGENYHLFAHRGLWYGTTMAERAGLKLPDALLERFQRGFATPFATVLPDFTLPSRRDSQYAISLRQWRIAEHCELGFARVADPVVLGALHRMYESSEPRRDTGRARSSADVERNAEPSSLTRADLSWRALLFAREALPAGGDAAPASTLLDAQGIAVFRRDAARVYVALDYGNSGGGHGHPDRLNLLLADGKTRWLDDFGTGSYVDPSLHWYRSTLAHNAPLVNGQSQQPVNGWLIAYDEQANAGWISARVADIAPGVQVTRTVMVLPEYVVDIVEWSADEEVVFDLPLHADLAIDTGASPLADARFDGGHAPDDGFVFVHGAKRQSVGAGEIVVARAVAADARLAVFARANVGTEWWSAIAPGAPGRGEEAFRVIRAHSSEGRYAFVWSLRGGVERVDFGDTLRVHLAGVVDEHRRDDGEWIIDSPSRGPRITLSGAAPVTEIDDSEFEETHEIRACNLGRDGLRFELGEAHYRRSEQSWAEAGSPTAVVQLTARGDQVRVDIDVPRSDRAFVASDALNPYDNEHPDINGDGVQLYVATMDGMSGFALIPERGSRRVRVRTIDGWSGPLSVSATWSPTADGYHMQIAFAAPQPVFGLDVLINERPTGRARRRGQLVMSGAAGEFVYLRGDRHDRTRLVLMRLTDV